jgi:hypothetical protein
MLPLPMYVFSVSHRRLRAMNRAAENRRPLKRGANAWTTMQRGTPRASVSKRPVERAPDFSPGIHARGIGLYTLNARSSRRSGIAMIDASMTP